VTGASRGNKALSRPIGLITADEVAFAGGSGNNTSYWLYTNQAYWTMTPYNVYSRGTAHEFYVNSNGFLDGTNVNYTNGVRPVINLKADTVLTGSGTTTDPYVVN